MGDDKKIGSAIYVKRKLKWYQKIWYFITGKKNNSWQLMGVTEYKPYKEGR